MEEAPTERRPINKADYLWTPRGRFTSPSGDESLVFYAPLRKILVLSSVVFVEAPTRNKCWHWFVTASHARRQLTDRELLVIRHDFEMLEAEEDAHHAFHVQVTGAPPRKRALWLPVPPEERGVCPCKENDDKDLIARAGGPIEVSGESLLESGQEGGRG